MPQLFGHCGAKTIANLWVEDPVTWVIETQESYKLWLSYFMGDINIKTDGTISVEEQELLLTRAGDSQLVRLGRAPFELVEHYINLVRHPFLPFFFSPFTGHTNLGDPEE